MEGTSSELEKTERKSSVSESIDENGPSSDGNEKASDNEKSDGRSRDVDENSCPVKTRESSTGTKAKRKVRSTRRRLNAMINNASLHFSDTDSEGELTTINTPLYALNTIPDAERKPVISITLDDAEVVRSNLLSPDDKGPCQRGNIVDSLTDIDEIYASEPENDQKENQNGLKVAEGSCQGETDLEDLEGDDEVHPTIYVESRSDIFCDYSGETITTKEGDGPFSVEVRNKMYREEVLRNPVNSTAPDIVVMYNTDEEYMDVSDEDEIEEACCGQKKLFEDLDVLAASQVVMRNINKMANMLTVRDDCDDAISDCHTDVEDVEAIE